MVGSGEHAAGSVWGRFVSTLRDDGQYTGIPVNQINPEQFLNTYIFQA